MKSKHVHILAICGYATTGLALMAKKLGYKVTGSDEDAYPPNSIILTREGIPWSNFHGNENLRKWGRPDLLIQGNQIRPDNRELLAAKRMDLKIISDSEFFYELTKRRRRIVVCGSHGKTTTSALVAWILEKSKRGPGFRLGTIAKNFGVSARLGQGREFVFEGDEYTTTFDDPRPKFFHFHPDVAVINNIEWDHPDVFKTFAIYRNLFKEYLVEKMSPAGLLVYNAEDEAVREVVRKARSKTFSFGLEKGDLQAKELDFRENQTTFVAYQRGRKLGTFMLKLPGIHNVRNSLAAVGVALAEEVGVGQIREALATFEGTSRRFEIVGKPGGITVIDDYAHHPTKVRETVDAARRKFPQARLLTIFVPHTYSRTKALLRWYGQAFEGAALVIIPDIEPARERHLSALIHSRELVARIRQYQNAVHYLPQQKEVLDLVCQEARSGDVVLCMSVRGFDNLARKLVLRLKSHKVIWKKHA